MGSLVQAHPGAQKEILSSISFLFPERNPHSFSCYSEIIRIFAPIINTQTMNENELDRLYGGNPLIKSTLEPACDFTGSHSTTEAARPVARDRESLLRDVFQRAKSLGTWIEIESDWQQPMTNSTTCRKFNKFT